MGEAKRNLEAVRQRLLAVVEGWMQPPSAEETAMVAAVAELPRLEVQRYPPHVLDYMRMKPGQCHANAQFMENEDPERLCRRVTGWTIADGQYVLHSLVLREGEYFCVTPVPRGFPATLTFVPDAQIAVELVGDQYVFSRDGIVIAYGLRPNPQATIAFAQQLKQRLESGMNPYSAMELPAPEL